MTTYRKTGERCADPMVVTALQGSGSRSRRQWVGSMLGMGLAATLGVGKAQTAARKWTVWVVPQFRAEVIHRAWTPVLQRLSQVTGQSFALTVAPSIPAFEKALLAGEPDLAYQNPYHQVMSRRAQGYVPLARDKKELTGILVVRREDPIKTPSELDQKTVAFPAPNAFGASLWIRALLAERDKITIRPSYVKTHSAAYRSAASGLSAAAGGINLTFEEEPVEIRNALRILMETPGVPPHPPERTSPRAGGTAGQYPPCPAGSGRRGGVARGHGRYPLGESGGCGLRPRLPPARAIRA